jgi:hypothetical protein
MPRSPVTHLGDANDPISDITPLAPQLNASLQRAAPVQQGAPDCRLVWWRMVKFGLSASPACAAVLASSSDPSSASAPARKKCVTG